MSRPDPVLTDPVAHRRETSRHVRRAARNRLHIAALDGEALDEAVLPEGCHDVGRKASPAPHKQLQPGRRPGFKVWKTPFWKRRRRLWAERNRAERRLLETD